MRSFYALWVMLLLGISGAVWADELRFDRAAAWRTWQMPNDLIQIDADGRLRLTKFRKEINAVANAGDFRHETKERDEVVGGIWEAKSNPQTANLIVDGDLETFWQPNPDDALDQWSVQLDLGRPVLARQIRLVFPDREGRGPCGNSASLSPRVPASRRSTMSSSLKRSIAHPDPIPLPNW